MCPKLSSCCLSTCFQVWVSRMHCFAIVIIACMSYFLYKLTQTRLYFRWFIVVINSILLKHILYVQIIAVGWKINKQFIIDHFWSLVMHLYKWKLSLPRCNVSNEHAHQNSWILGFITEQMSSITGSRMLWHNAMCLAVQLHGAMRIREAVKIS